jgi:predicted  nucleic acid-binding Zn-ribbon protein
MQTRHRIPSIFNLSMVDVLCCALGCVLLLWLLNLREARDRAAEASQTEQQLSATRQELEAARNDLSAVRGELADLMVTTAGLTANLDRARQEAAANQQRYTRAEGQAQSTAAALEKTQAERDAARTAMTELEKKLAAAGRRAEQLTGRVSDAEGRIKQLQAQADQLPGLREEIKNYRDKFNAEHALAQALEKTIKQRLEELAARDKELDALRSTRRTLEMSLAARDKELALAQRSVQALEGERKNLQGEVNRAKAAAENRFAGINLTGRRVVFLVDRSGSMGLIDPDTEAKDKWPTVCRTVAQIMRSLPDLEKFQVIDFSTDASFLLGQDDRWIDYDPATSPDRVLRTLLSTQPRGGTNLYAAFEKAFRLRALGMDTIYLLSDGIPDRGAGLPAEAQRLSEVERSTILARHVRRTLQYEWNRPRAGQPPVRINCVGFFYESPDVGAFLWALARENDGSFVGMSRP